MTLQQAEAVLKRCQVGTRAGNRSYDAANALHNDCFHVIAFLLQRVRELERGEFICQTCGLRKDAECKSPPEF